MAPKKMSARSKRADPLRAPRAGAMLCDAVGTRGRPRAPAAACIRCTSRLAAFNSRMQSATCTYARSNSMVRFAIRSRFGVCM